jgi:hypothetical protein
MIIETILSYSLWLIENPIKSFVILFVQYVILMELCAMTRGTLWEKPVKYTLGPVFLFQDWIVNVFAMSALMLNPPHSVFEVVTSRMTRYKITYSWRAESELTRLQKWRLAFAYWLCRHLNRYDSSGVHC